MTDQCPTCGRVSEDWGANREALKGHQRIDTDDRLADYRSWRFSWGGGAFVSDLDQIEWRMDGGAIRPVAIFEMTRLDGNMTPPRGYFIAIEKRFTERDGQAAAVLEFGRRLGVPVAIVLFRHDLSEFWVYVLSNPSKWFHFPAPAYKLWVEGLS